MRLGEISKARRCHGDLPGALGVLRATADQVETRFPLSWIKLRMEEIRLLRTTDEASATQLAQGVSKRAMQLGLTHQCKRIKPSSKTVLSLPVQRPPGCPGSESVRCLGGASMDRLWHVQAS